MILLKTPTETQTQTWYLKCLWNGNLFYLNHVFTSKKYCMRNEVYVLINNFADILNSSFWLPRLRGVKEMFYPSLNLSLRARGSGALWRRGRNWGRRAWQGGYSCEYLVGVCRPVLQILTLFQTKKCNFPPPFSDQTSKIHICLCRPGL